MGTQRKTRRRIAPHLSSHVSIYQLNKWTSYITHSNISVYVQHDESACIHVPHVGFHLCLSDDYNRVLLKLDEGHSRDSEPDEDEEEESSDEEDEESTKYINASHIDVCYLTNTFSVFTNLCLQKAT